MWPLTCGAMPTKLARTVASSVCGRISHWSSVTTTAMTAAVTIAMPSSRPRMRRKPASGCPVSSVMASDPEKRHPEDERDEECQTRIHERSRAHIGIDPGAHQEPADKEGPHDSEDRTKHPGREERADDV